MLKPTWEIAQTHYAEHLEKPFFGELVDFLTRGKVRALNIEGVGKVNKMLGTFSWYGYNLPLATRVNQIRNAGFDSTMVWWGDEVAFQDGSKERIIEIVSNSGLVIENIHVPFEGCNDFWSDSEMVRQKVMDSHYEWLEDCAAFGIPMMVMHLVKGNLVTNPSLTGIKCIESLVKRAESYHVKIAVENTRVNEVIVTVLDEIPSKTLGLCYDSSHDRLYSGNEFEILKKCGQRLLATHLSDNDGLKDQHWLPKRGIINWEGLFEAFPKEYQGCISLEVEKGMDALTSEEFLHHAFEKARWIESNVRKII